MKVIDMHIHVFPDDVVDDYIENYSQHSKLKAACRPTLPTLFEEYKDFDVLKYVILQEWESTKPFDSENLRFAAESDRYYTKCYFYTFNQWLGKIQKENDNLICFGGVHPDDPDYVAEFEKMENQYGLSGMKLVPCMQHFFLNDRRLFPVYEKAEASGMPILVHTGGDPIPGREVYGHPRDIDEVASTFPDLTIIMAHMGIPFFEETKEILKKHKNVFTDIAFSVVYDDVLSFSEQHDIDASFLTYEFWNETLSSLIKDFGYEKVLFGSDFPFIKPSRAIKAFLDLDISDDGKEMILWKNASELLKI
ncbi:MAG: amidohydrolase [Desulfobacteraceae bacterium]|nr:amidohydrolase [Desulfobacteraceae bacterium]MBC2754462.1 amidohydrolase [Desulfobacteraceae bacterium]